MKWKHGSERVEVFGLVWYVRGYKPEREERQKQIKMDEGERCTGGDGANREITVNPS